MLNFDLNVTEVGSAGSNWQYSSIGLDDGLAPNRREAIIWTSDDLVCWHIYASLGLNELTLYNDDKQTRSESMAFGAGNWRSLLSTHTGQPKRSHPTYQSLRK